MVKRKEKVITEVLNKKAEVAASEKVAKDVEKASADKDIVIVYCGIPMGLVMTRHNGEEVLLRGQPISNLVSATTGAYLPAGKYGETKLPKSVWEELLEKYKKYDFIENGVVFAKESAVEGREVAKEKSKANLGFEQVDTKKTKTKKVETEE